MASRAARLNAMYSASVVDLVTELCRLLHQLTVALGILKK